jgi:signal transduction histidine kinase/uncharacterized membrane protein YdjX (TVP38/TMEM64 family)
MTIASTAKRFLPLIAIAAAVTTFFAAGLDRYLSLQALEQNRATLVALVDRWDVLAGLAYGAAYAVLVAFSIPIGAIATIAAGFLFGIIYGTVIVVIGATLGAIGIFLAAKTSVGDLLLRRAGPAIRRMEAGFRENAFNYMLVLRLVPLFPFWLVNLAPAFLGVGLRSFALATVIGIIPGTAVYVGVGNGLGEVLDAGGTPDLHIIFRPAILLPIIGLAVLSLVPVIYRSLRRLTASKGISEPAEAEVGQPSFGRGLSAQLLGLTILFVMLAEVFIYVPSIAKFRRDFLNERLVAAQLATLALEATPDNMVNDALQAELLATADVRAVILQRTDSRRLMLAEKMPPSVTADYDLRTDGPIKLIVDAFATLARHGTGLIRVTGLPQGAAGEYIEIIYQEGSLYKAMVTYSTNILTLSIIVSVFTAGLLYMSVNFLLVRPMRQIATTMVRFREAPEDVSRNIKLTDRRDEIGMAMRELAKMQSELRAALQQKTHLANLGVAVSKINHDLRNILASAQLVSDRLAALEDPTVQRLTPTLIASIDRAIDLCKQTLRYGRAEEHPPQIKPIMVWDATQTIAEYLGLDGESRVRWINNVDRGFEIRADPDQLHRVLLNLCRNAREAIEGEGSITVSAYRKNAFDRIEIEDTGPGLPANTREHLFEPFRGGTRADSTGLGLSIARELIRAHGGDICLVRSDDTGTVFRVSLPHEGA